MVVTHVCGTLPVALSCRRAKKAATTADTPSVTFADVAGVDAAKEELLEVRGITCVLTINRLYLPVCTDSAHFSHYPCP